MREELTRTRMLIGDEALLRLADARVAVFGIGGVGGYVVEALARSGVGALDLIDRDVVDITNINRQIIASQATIGRGKAEVAAERIALINPDCRVEVYPLFYLPETADQFDFSQFDYVVDAVDTVTAKLSLVERAAEAGVPILSAMGAGNKLDPTAFRVADIYDTSICPLARVMRRECKKRGIRSLKVVYSTEKPICVGRPPGSIAFAPAACGLVMASEVIRDLTA
ncbi:MAG: tRNA threonylcarbamoyladenosine dehydratase [Lachnospiraceae bacterium]|nr:tRNA threonylcarbamoyladenosine dehydratase [Lachnospiraceae bacterium]